MNVDEKTLPPQPQAQELLQECQQLADLLNKKYRVYIGDKLFTLTSFVQDDLLHVKVLLSSSDESFYYPVEARVDYQQEELTKNEGLYFLVDYIDIYLEEFLIDDDSVFLPIDWATHQYDAVNFQIRGQIFNRRVELLADQLLACDTL